MKGFSRDFLRERYAVLRKQSEECGRILVIGGPLSEAFIEAFRIFEEQRKELKTLLKEFRLQWIKGLPVLEITRECGSVDEYREKLRDEGCKIWTNAGFMLDNVTIRKTDGRKVTLVKVDPEDLGLTEESTGSEILAAAEKKGLKRCPLWTALQYRLDCGDNEDNTFIGMEPVPDIDNDLSVFIIFRDFNGPGLSDHSIYSFGDPDDKWVFVVPE